MESILHITTGQRLGTAAGSLVVEVDQQVMATLPTDNVAAVLVESQQCSITVSAHLLCSRNQIPLIICNERYEPEVLGLSLYSYHELTRSLHAQIMWSAERKKTLFAQLLQRKVQHQAQLLQHVEALDSTVGALNRIAQQLVQPNADLDGLEAVAARMYFGELFGPSFRRFAPDTLNAALNYGYSLLRAVIKTQLVCKGLHPSLGLWHCSMRNNYNLADDLIELYRPMVDYVVYHNIPAEGAFLKEQRQCLMLLLLQQLNHGTSRLDYRRSVAQLIDQMNSFMDKKSEQLALPQLQIAWYEY